MKFTLSVISMAEITIPNVIHSLHNAKETNSSNNFMNTLKVLTHFFH